MLTSKKDETEQRLNAILQKLSGITFVPENWNESAFWNTLSETGISQNDILELDQNSFFQKFIELKWPWQQIEKLADLLVVLNTKQPNELIRERAKNLYLFIQTESKMFSFEIMTKIGKL